MRDAPGEIRRRSFDFEYQVDFASGRPKGWFDVDRETRILEDVTFCDWGDIRVEYGESQRDFFRRTADVVEKIVAAGSLPVVLGGDHTVSFPVIDVLQRRRKLSVLYLDSHTDFDPSIREEVVSAVCVGRRIWKLAGVERLVQVGHRGYTLNAKVEKAPDGVEIIPVAHFRREGASAILSALPTELPVYVSIDINVLDPIYAPAGGRPTPGGFSLDEVKEILHAVGAARDIVGLDLVEANPGCDIGSITSIVACHLILAALGAATARR